MNITVDARNKCFTTRNSYSQILVNKNRNFRQSKKKLQYDKSKVPSNLLFAVAAIATLGMIAIPRITAYLLHNMYSKHTIIRKNGEKFVYNDAKTLQEGIDYAKNVLKIEKFDKNMSLDILNFINKGIVDVINASETPVLVPKKYNLINDKDNYSGMAHPISLTLDIKPRIIESTKKTAEDFLSMLLQPPKDDFGYFFAAHDKTYYLGKLNFPQEVQNLIDKYKNHREDMTISEYMQITKSLFLTLRENNLLNCKIDMEKSKFDKLSREEKVLLTKNAVSEDLFNKFSTTGLSMSEISDCPYGLIAHEMGHFQDYLKNVLKYVFGKMLFLPKDIANRWLGTTYLNGYYKIMLDKSPKLFKFLYPDLYEHLTNQKIQETAGKISKYAQTSIGEFIAEVFSLLVYGKKKLPSDVIELYKKYNGPMLKT